MRIITNHAKDGRLQQVEVLEIDSIIKYRIPNGAEGHELIAIDVNGGETVLARRGSLDECLALLEQINEAAEDGDTVYDCRQKFKTNGR